MEKCKVVFSNENKQSIILELELDNSGNLDYHVRFHPIVKDPKTKLGLAGKMCEIFIESLINGKDTKEQD